MFSEGIHKPFFRDAAVRVLFMGARTWENWNTAAAAAAATTDSDTEPNNAIRWPGGAHKFWAVALAGMVLSLRRWDFVTPIGYMWPSS